MVTLYLFWLFFRNPVNPVQKLLSGFSRNDILNQQLFGISIIFSGRSYRIIPCKLELDLTPGGYGYYPSTVKGLIIIVTVCRNICFVYRTRYGWQKLYERCLQIVGGAQKFTLFRALLS